MNFKKWVKSIQTSGYNGARTIVECYCTWTIEILSYFFILTTSKMRNFQTIKLSQLPKAKTCWTENYWSSGIMSNFWGHFLFCFGGRSSVCTKKLHKMKLKIYISSLLQYSITYTQNLTNKSQFLAPLVVSKIRIGCWHLVNDINLAYT